MKSIVEGMLDFRYTDDNPVGFLLSQADDSKIKGKHVCKIKETESNINPYGEVYQTSFEKYIVNEFLIHKGYLELHDPCKTLKYFKKDLLRSFDNRLNIFDFNLNALDFLGCLLNRYEGSYLKEVDLVSYNIIGNANTKMTVKGDNTVLDSLNVLFKKSSYKVSKFSIVFNWVNRPDVIVEVSGKGSFNFSSVDLSKSFIEEFLMFTKSWRA